MHAYSTTNRTTPHHPAFPPPSQRYEPDVLCLQEVVVEVAGDFMRGLHALGYLEDDIVTAGCADVHVLPSDQPR